MSKETASKTPNGVPVFHADHGLEDAHYAFIDTVLSMHEGFFVATMPLPDHCPNLTSALYGPAAGDPPVTEEEVEYRVRNNRPGPSRLVNKPHRPCRNIVVVGIAGADAKVFTAYGTQSEDPSPREWWDTSMKPLEAVESAQFWAEHALAV